MLDGRLVFFLESACSRQLVNVSYPSSFWGCRRIDGYWSDLEGLRARGRKEGSTWGGIGLSRFVWLVRSSVVDVRLLPAGLLEGAGCGCWGMLGVLGGWCLSAGLGLGRSTVST